MHRSLIGRAPSLLLLAIAVLAVAANASGLDAKKVNASEIMDRIKLGDGVSYDGAAITGELDLSRLNLALSNRGKGATPKISITNSIFEDKVNLSGHQFASNIDFWNMPIFNRPYSQILTAWERSFIRTPTSITQHSTSTTQASLTIQSSKVMRASRLLSFEATPTSPDHSSMAMRTFSMRSSIRRPAWTAQGSSDVPTSTIRGSRITSTSAA